MYASNKMFYDQIVYSTHIGFRVLFFRNDSPCGIDLTDFPFMMDLKLNPCTFVQRDGKCFDFDSYFAL